jgi:chromosome segregation ATPase
VKNANPDDYSEVNEISDRHKTLAKASKNQHEKKAEITEMYEAKRREVHNYEKTMSTKLMSLNNEIAELTTKCDEVEAEKSALQNNEEETSAKKWDQIGELSQVIFAIEMIENLCSVKSKYHTTGLPYAN